MWKLLVFFICIQLQAVQLMGQQMPFRISFSTLDTDLFCGLGLRYRINENVGQEFIPGKDRMILFVDASIADSKAQADLVKEGNFRPRVHAGIRLMWR
jgi:hypothetical protein